MCISHTTEKLFNLALQTAQLSQVSQYCHGAVITRGSRPLILSVNTKDKTHPQSWSLWTQHAEFSAIIRLGLDVLKNQTGNTTLFSARVGSDGNPRMSKPCVNCMRFIKMADINKVVWWDRDTQQIECRKVKDM